MSGSVRSSLKQVNEGNYYYLLEQRWMGDFLQILHLSATGQARLSLRESASLADVGQCKHLPNTA